MPAVTTYAQIKMREAFDAEIFVQQARAAEQVPDPPEVPRAKL